MIKITHKLNLSGFKNLTGLSCGI